jgi:beta-lactamase class A
VRGRSPFSALRWFSLLFILAGVILLTFQVVRFSRLWMNYPPGVTIAGIPVGHLNRQQAAERLLSAYTVPVELYYGEAVIQLSPTVVGVELDLDKMLSAAEMERTRQSFWDAFWNYLWGSTVVNADVPLQINYSQERLRLYLENEVATRYDQPATSAMPIVGTVFFQSGRMGTALDIDRAVLLIDVALRSPNQRSVVLPLQRTNPQRPPFQNLEVLLKQTVSISNFDGLLAVYLMDLQTGQELHFVQQQRQNIALHPDVAFSASSTIKIPILVSVMRRMDPQGDPEEYARAKLLMEEMIMRSGNPPADALMERYLDRIRGPLIVTEDMQALGLESTFLSGYFFAGAPLLVRQLTPANQRADIITTPDPYSQTTVTEMGMLLADIYQCAQNGGGGLMAVFPDDFSPAKCQVMIDLLLKNNIAVLIQAGLADGTPIAHKHGWITDIYGITHDMSDAGIVYTPGGNYVLVIFVYHPREIIWDAGSRLVADLSRAVYNFYNLPSP